MLPTQSTTATARFRTRPDQQCKESANPQANQAAPTVTGPSPSRPPSPKWANTATATGPQRLIPLRTQPATQLWHGMHCVLCKVTNTTLSNLNKRRQYSIQMDLSLLQRLSVHFINAPADIRKNNSGNATKASGAWPLPQPPLQALKASQQQGPVSLLAHMQTSAHGLPVCARTGTLQCDCVMLSETQDGSIPGRCSQRKGPAHTRLRMT